MKKTAFALFRPDFYLTEANDYSQENRAKIRIRIWNPRRVNKLIKKIKQGNSVVGNFCLSSKKIVIQWNKISPNSLYSLYIQKQGIYIRDLLFGLG